MTWNIKIKYVSTHNNRLALTHRPPHPPQVCRLYGGVRRFVNVSTDEVYGETSLGLAAGLSEASRLEPTNPYSAAKAGAEMMAAAYFTSYKLPVLTTRGNNVYGPGQFPEKLVPKVGCGLWGLGRVWVGRGVVSGLGEVVWGWVEVWAHWALAKGIQIDNA